MSHSVLLSLLACSALPLRSRTGTMAPLDPIIIFGEFLLLAGIEPRSFDSRFVRYGPSSVTTQEGCHMKGGSKLLSLAMVL